MTTKMFLTTAFLGVVLGVGTRPAAAQTIETVKVNLPVDAKVGNVVLPAGHYSIREWNTSVLEITSDSQKGVNAFLPVISVSGRGAADHTKVTLRKDDSGRFELETVWLEGQQNGFEFTASAE
jgi:hypothetical protein